MKPWETDEEPPNQIGALAGGRYAGLQPISPFPTAEGPGGCGSRSAALRVRASADASGVQDRETRAAAPAASGNPRGSGPARAIGASSGAAASQASQGALTGAASEASPQDAGAHRTRSREESA